MSSSRLAACFSSNKNAIGYAVIITVGVVLALLVMAKSKTDYEQVLQRYQQTSEMEAEAAAKNLGYSLKQLYQGIRTISLLPGVKAIDRYGKNLDSNAHESIVQIYNNMVSNVAVSEIYIVPVDIEPDVLDPNTGELGAPILMYDGSAENPNEAPKPKITTIEMAMKAPEIEIYEYRLLKEQMGYLREKYPDQGHTDALSLPFIGGKPVLTCDNADYEKTKENADRTGIVLSVPFFGLDGRLKGTITAVIRNNMIRDMLPTKDYAVFNDTYKYQVLSKEDGQQQASGQWIEQGKPDPSLLFSKVIPISTSDPRSQWSVWVGYPDAKFMESGDVKAVNNFKLAGYGLSVVLTVLGSVLWAVLQRSASVVKNRMLQLEKDVATKIAENERLASEREMEKHQAEQKKREEMQELAESFEFSVKGVVAQVASSAVQMKEGAEDVTHIANDTKKRSSSVAEIANEAAQTSAQVAAAAEELTASIKEISAQTQKSSHVANEAAAKAEYAKKAIHTLSEKSMRVGEIIEVITGIAGQINLLALNATIESARAGEAGKGFAVVASEVKNLANQVGKATDEITKQINEMQGATQNSVDSVMDILGIIGQVSSSTSAVAAAVEEQSAVTNEIASNVAKTSSGAQQISHNITTVQDGADKTGATAQHLLESAKTLGAQSDMLKQKVDEFLNTIRA